MVAETAHPRAAARRFLLTLVDLDYMRVSDEDIEKSAQAISTAAQCIAGGGA